METRASHVAAGAIVLLLAIALPLLLAWSAKEAGTPARKYAIDFARPVDGLARGSPVTLSGVRIGDVEGIAVRADDPELVRVRIRVDAHAPVLEGTSATLRGSLTGASGVALHGARRGAPPIACPKAGASCPSGVPAIPEARGPGGAAATSAPELAGRAAGLAERMREVLSERNRRSASGIGRNMRRLRQALGARGHEIRGMSAEARSTGRRMAEASRQVRAVESSGRALVRDDVRPTLARLGDAVASAQLAGNSIEGAATELRPGLEGLRRQTLPEARLLAAEARRLGSSASAVRDRARADGAAALLGARPLPAHRPTRGTTPER